MKKLLFGLFFVSFLALGACSGGGDEEGAGDQSDPSTEENADQGSSEQANSDVDAKEAKQAFEENNCISCHGGDLSGGYGPSLQKVGKKYSEDDIKEIISKGKGSMPPQSVSDEDKNLIASWLAAKK
ncbi:cytochrome c [Halobacillus salinarum]|uniref:Cytochrome c n=1 Tax=Halobacillus salinarum TaxID=2932257 RepID=A0ABY4EMQ7_9BACI|nr:cytochrome c [Halobacillus salinarum]UOQ45741.1 cytochrome c [Halobacillus salinarum]